MFNSSLYKKCELIQQINYIAYVEISETENLELPAEAFSNTLAISDRMKY